MSHAVRRAASLVFVFALLVLTLGPINTTGASAATAYYLSPSGNDSNPGTEAAPFRTFTAALPKLRAGDTLLVRGETYVENAILNGSATLAKGTPSSRITVQAYPGENPVLQGILHLSNADYWTIDNIDVTWNPANTDTTQHMFRFFKGTGWELKNSELYGARSYAALLVNGGASGFAIRNNYIHDTLPSNGQSQDHSVYIADGNNGVIEYNLLTNAPNGRGVKLGHSSGGLGTPHSVTVRYNTMVGNGAANVSLSYDSNNHKIFGNIMVTAGSGYTNVGTYNQTGPNNVISDNVGWDAKGVLKDDPILVDGGGNMYANPQLDSSYRPQNPALYDSNGVLRFGHLAGNSTAPVPTPPAPPSTPTPSPTPTTPPSTPEPTPTPPPATPTPPQATPTPAPTSTPAPPVTVDAEVVSVSMPATVAPGTTAIVTVTLRNNGSTHATIPVTLRGVPNGFAQSSSVTIAAGQTASTTFSWAAPGSVAAGTHTFTATSVLNADSNPANNSASTTTSVPTPVSATMSVSNVTLDRPSWFSLRGIVTVRSNGVAVQGATVTVQFTDSYRRTTTLSAVTNAAGEATFTRSALLRGAYTLTVTNVARPGLTYNASGNAKTTASYTI